MLFVELGRASFIGYAPPVAVVPVDDDSEEDGEGEGPGEGAGDGGRTKKPGAHQAQAQVQAAQAWPNEDFVVSYRVVSDDASAAVLVQAPYEEDPDTRALCCVSVAPPDASHHPVRLQDWSP